MIDRLTERLNEVLPRVISDEFLSGAGIGNEIAFYIFDYPPEHEVRVRKHVEFLLEHIPKQKPGMRVRHINLLEFVTDHLRSRNLLDKACKMLREKGSPFVLRHLEKILDPEKLKHVFVQVARPDEHDLVIISGVGSAYPMLRMHRLLNNLHSVMGQTPLLMFYPGHYDGQYLRLFGKLKNDNYYRAFKLVS